MAFGRHESGRFTPVERLLRLFAPVERSESATALALFANILLILIAYYLIKPVRESWLAISVFRDFTPLEVRAYSAVVQSLLLFALLPYYAWLAARLPRAVVIARMGYVFGAGLLLFWWLRRADVPYAGIAFYVFVGIFNVAHVAQFWAFASDVYGPERGHRLFPLVAIGAALGAVVGSWLGGAIIATGLDVYALIPLTLLPLSLAVSAALWTDRRAVRTHLDPAERLSEPAAPTGDGPYGLIRKDRYLAATAAMTVLFSWVVTSGDNILFGLVQEALAEEVAHLPVDSEARERYVGEGTGEFYSGLYFWINLIGLLLQAFVVSRVLNARGFGTLLMVTPVLSLLASVSLLFAPLLGVMKLVKVLENSSNLSMNNTARHVLWLPTSRELLYRAKPAIDTLCVRLGDLGAAVTVLAGSRILELSLSSFILLNLVLSLLWIRLAALVAREHRHLLARTAEADG